MQLRIKMEKHISVKKRVNPTPTMNQETLNMNVPEDPIQREIKALEKNNRKQEEKIQNQEARAAQNVNLYFIFQAVILASTTVASSPQCSQWWIPFTLSLITAVINLYTFCSSMFRVLKLRDELDQSLVDLELIKVQRMTWVQVNQVLPGAAFNCPPQDCQKGGIGKELVRPKAGSIQRWKRRVQVICTLGLFVGFTVVLVLGCYTVLCRSSGECVKLC